MDVIRYQCPICGWRGHAKERVEFNGVQCCPVCVRIRKTPHVPRRVVSEETKGEWTK